MNKILLATLLALLMMNGCAHSRSTCQENVALILDSTCSPEQKNKLAYAAVAGCSKQMSQASAWVNRLIALRQPLQCEQIPNTNFKFSYNMATTPLLVKEKTVKPKSSQSPKRTNCLSGDTIRDVMAKIQGQAKYCYEKALLFYPSLSGRVTTSFGIDANGAVVWTGVKDTTMYHRGVEDCLVEVIEKSHFLYQLRT